MRHVDLCSGIGGFALGFEWAGLSKPVLFCDIEPWSRKILAKHWPDVPIAEDVKELANDPDGLIPDCDIITAGYPCQPFSVAGQRRGTEDDRHIWPYIFSIIQRKRPSWCVFENVYGHVSMGLDEVLFDLESETYAARPFIVPACGVNAPHRRDRLWIIARNVGDTKHDGSFTSTIKRSVKEAGYNKSEGQSEASQSAGTSQPRDSASMEGSAKADNVAYASRLHINGSGEHSQQSERQVPQLGDSRGSVNVAYTASKRQQGSRLHGRPQHQTQDQVGQADRADNSSQRNAHFWLPEPAICRVVNGIPRRVDRLRGLGNAIVPQIAEQIALTIKKVSE